MVLPHVAKTPVLLMRFTPKASRDVILEAIGALTQGGIIVLEAVGLRDEDAVGGGRRPSGLNGHVVLGLTTTQKHLEHEAEIVRLVKPCRTSHEHIPTVMEHFSREARGDFVGVERGDDDDRDAEGLFTSSDRALLVDSMIAAIDAPQTLISHRPSMISTALEACDRLAHSSISKSCHMLRDSIQDYEYAQCASNLSQYLRRRGYIDVLSPVHVPHIKKKILKDTYSIRTGLPLEAIRNYYGAEVAFYFAWMDFMTRWFTFPGALGLVVYACQTYRGRNVDNCELTPFVGLATLIWAFACNRFWERHEMELAYKWGTFASTDWDRRSLGKRAGFRGTPRRSPITGSMELYYPVSRRRIKYVVNAIITLFLLAAACVVMVIGMNLQGYMNHADGGEGDHPLDFPFFSQLSEENGIFDAKSWWKSFLPVILRVFVVSHMNDQYSKIAEVLTEWENHETRQSHQNSVILKRVLFEAFDAYVVLFYLALYERDIHLLRFELMGAFNVDSLRRVSTESIFPYIVKYFKQDSDPVESRKKKDDDLEEDTTDSFLTSEADLDEHDIFYDYIEMLVQFGYVTLFASAYPLAAFFAIGANLIEIRSDMWKLTQIVRRMTPVRTDSIGMWKVSLSVITWLAAGSNLLIFAFTSSQMRNWFPDYFEIDEVTGRHRPEASSTCQIHLIILIVQNCLIAAIKLVREGIPNTPQFVSDEVQKYMFYQEHLASKARLRSVRRTMGQIGDLSNIKVRVRQTCTSRIHL